MVDGCDNISIKMIKTCSQLLNLPLKVIFKQSLKKGKFREIWKKANVVSVYKKENKMLVKNYRSISLLPFFKVIDFSYLPNLVFFQEIHVLPNYYQ